MRDGTVQHMTAPAALAAGVEVIVGRSILDDMLADAASN